MKMKKYQAATISRAMSRVKRDLGMEAVVLQVKRKKKFGKFLFPRKQYYEVIASCGTDVNVPEPYRPSERLTKVSEHDQAQRTAVAVPPETSVDDDAQSIDYQLRFKEVQSEMDRLKSAFAKVLAERNIHIKPKFKGKAGALYDSLLQRGIGEELAQRLIYLLKEAKSELESEGLGTRRLLMDHFSRKLGTIFNTDAQIETEHQGRRVITMIGPTGEGKTTTIAKLAANYSLVVGKKVAFISADTYRIAAAEQLKIYAEIINIPLEVVYTPIELSRALEKFSDMDLVFIDTAGRSPSNSLHMSELKAYLNAAGSDETYLVLSATKKLSDMQHTVDRFQGVDVRSYIFTKLDETVDLDSVMNCAYRAKHPLSYFCIGQNVPDDVELANTDKFVEFIFRGIAGNGPGATAP